MAASTAQFLSKHSRRTFETHLSHNITHNGTSNIEWHTFDRFSCRHFSISFAPSFDRWLFSCRHVLCLYVADNIIMLLFVRFSSQQLGHIERMAHISEMTQTQRKQKKTELYRIAVTSRQHTRNTYPIAFAWVWAHNTHTQPNGDITFLNVISNRVSLMGNQSIYITILSKANHL